VQPSTHCWISRPIRQLVQHSYQGLCRTSRMGWKGGRHSSRHCLSSWTGCSRRQRNGTSQLRYNKRPLHRSPAMSFSMFPRSPKPSLLQVPSAYVCPLTMEVFRDPVITPAGVTKDAECQTRICTQSERLNWAEDCVHWLHLQATAMSGPLFLSTCVSWESLTPSPETCV
jgi:hypothetical protein